MADLIERYVNKKKRGKYPVSIRKFALAVSFYSTKAYNFLRKEWPSLPAPSTLKSWYQVVDCSPGFTKQAFDALAEIVFFNRAQGKETIVNLVLDEMKIKKRVEFEPNSQRSFGYVDMGTGMGCDDDFQHQATGMFVMMAVAVNSFWKVPLGYFAISSINGTERSNLVSLALTQLHDAGVKCCSLTFDCESANIAMINHLGSNIRSGSPAYKPWFPHPTAENKVFVYPDPSHMVKLVRNTFGERGPLKDGEGRVVCWSFIRKLHSKQQQEGLHAATKLSKRHINYASENKMNVSLAVQVLSNSTSIALDWLRTRDSLFEGAEGTVEFCRNFDEAFNILNCRSLFSTKPFQKPIRPETLEPMKQRAEQLIQYISNLRLSECDSSITDSPRRAGFLGFLVCLDNVFKIYEQMREWGMTFLLSYKMLQDHLENFFSAVRGKGGYNNNPTCRQFESAYRKLLVHGIIVTSQRSNCILDNTNLLHCSRQNTPVHDEQIGEDPCEDSTLSGMGHDYLSTAWDLNEYHGEILEYIGGFIVKRLKKKIPLQ